MQVLNLEVAKYGIRVNATSPAAATRMTATIADLSEARCFAFGDKVAEVIEQTARDVVPRSRSRLGPQ